MSTFHTVAKWTYIVFQVLALISTFVAFGAQLISESDPNGSSSSWKWNEADVYYVIVPGTPGQTVTHKYDPSSSDARFSGCYGGGQGLIALAIISLLVFVLVSLPLAILRACNSEHSFPKLGSNPYRYTTVEFGTACWHAFSFFCQCVIWGGTCFRLVRNDISDYDADVKATGFAYIGVCCALMLLNLGLMWYLRRERLNETGATGSTATGGAENRAAFASVYNAAASQEGAPAPNAPGGYGDIAPAAAPSAQGGATAATAGGGGYQSF